MAKIKVAQVITRLDWGGSPDIVRIICSNLDANVYDVRLVTGRTKYPSARTLAFINSFRGKITVIPQLKRNIEPLSDLIALIRLYFFFKKERFDIVHTHTAKAGALARLAAFLSGTGPVIIHTPHGHNFYGYFNPFLSGVIIAIEKFISGFTDKIIALTQLEKNDLVRYKVADVDKIRVIYQGLELGDYLNMNTAAHAVKQSLGLDSDAPVIGMVGRLEPVKGPDYFVESASFVVKDNPGARFVVVGEGSLREKLEKRVKSLGLKDKFIFTGWREDVPQIISVFDVLVLPSLNEAVGIVLIEAQAEGVAVVAASVGGVPEIVKDKETGILVAAKDPNAIALAVNYLLRDEEKRKEMGAKAKEWVKGRFSASSMINSISNLYRDTLATKAKCVP